MMKTAVCVVCLVAAVAWGAPAVQYKPLRLREVASLQFFAGQPALNTRSAEWIPQLECAYNPMNDESVLPTVVTCFNKGVDHLGSIMWKCDGITSKSVEFDNLQVSCESYDMPGYEEFVKEGSCALRYTLKMASPMNNNNDRRPFQHEETYPHEYRNRVPREQPHYRTEQVEATTGWSFSTVLILVLVAVLVIRCCCGKKKNRTTNTNVNSSNVNKGQPSGSENGPQPSAPSYPDDNDSNAFVKRSGFAETVFR